MQNRRWCSWLFFVILAAAGSFVTAHGAEPEPEIVVAIRYLQQTGTSHAHLYLFREDGKLLRQLTKDDSGQDLAPVFAPDGESIVFTRGSPGGKQWWSVEPRGGNLRQLVVAPDWYASAKPSPSFQGTEAGLHQDYSANSVVLPTNGTAELVLTPTPAGKKDVPYNPEEWYVKLRGTGAGGTIRLPDKLPGWAPSLLVSETNEKTPVLQEGSWQVVFLSTSLGSMDGGTIHAVCLNKPGMVRLARNWVDPYPLPGETAFLSNAVERYVPFGDGGHTANCTYLDLWNAGLKRTRFARKDAAALCYGASMYRPSKAPAVIIVPYDEKDDK